MCDGLYFVAKEYVWCACGGVFVYAFGCRYGAVATVLMKLDAEEKREFFGYLFPIEIPRMSSGKPFGVSAIYLWFILWNLMCLGVYFEFLPLASATIVDYLAVFVVSFLQLWGAVVVCFHLVYVFFYQSDM